MVFKITLKLVVILNIATLSTNNFICPSPGYHPDPNSCTSFFRCVDFKTNFKYLCPAGTIYDANMRMCNHETVAPPCRIATEDSGESQTKQPGVAQTKPTTRRPTLPTPKRTTAKPTTTTMRPESSTSSAVQDIKPPVFPPPLSTPIPAKPTPTNNFSPTLIVTKTPLPERNYSVSPTSLYRCQQPEYYEEETTCDQFYTCREIAPGVLSADRIFSCPDKYLFNAETRLCQKEENITCQKKKSEDFLFYTVLNALVVQLKEEQLEEFFSSRLQLPLPRPKTYINPKITLYGNDENPYPWVIFQSAIH